MQHAFMKAFHGEEKGEGEVRATLLLFPFSPLVISTVTKESGTRALNTIPIPSHNT